MSKLVSIIMGIYNCENTLCESINSVISQTYLNWNLILCDDGSTDGTYKIALEYSLKDSRITVIKNEKNMGLAYSLNHCIKYANGEYIMRHDGDDLMIQNRIEQQIKFLENNVCDACGSWAYIFDETGTWGLRQPVENPHKDCMITGSPFIHPTVAFKKEVLIKVGGYSENKYTFQRLEDYELWIKLFENGYILKNIQEPLQKVREDRNSYSRKKRIFRLTEAYTRLLACQRLNISYFKRFLALKPIIVMFVPKKILRKYHVNRASMKVRNDV